MPFSSNKLLIKVSTAHAVSHIHMMVIPAMLPLLPQVMGVNFIELGIAIGVFNIVSALVQAPLGFMVDKVGARKMLIMALALGSLCFGALALFPNYIGLLIAMGLAGLANGVYHPADYALLSRGINSAKMGRAFSIHTSAGFLGGALTPPMMVGIAVAWGVSWAFMVAAFIGFAALAYVAVGTIEHNQALNETKKLDNNLNSRPLKIPLATLAILTTFFTLLSLSTGAIEKFSVSALIQGFNVPLVVANTALTAFMFSSAAGVLVGGGLADRTKRHGTLAAIAFALAALVVAFVASIHLPSSGLIIAWGVVGFLTGMVAPSRDMLVRAASPVGAEGRTFGIVSTGFNVGGVLGPILFGFLLDKNLGIGVLWSAVIFMLITTIIVLFQERRARAH